MSQNASIPNLLQQVIGNFAKMSAFDTSIDSFVTIRMVETNE